MKIQKLLYLLCSLYSACGYATTDLYVDENQGLLTMLGDGEVLLSSKYVFFGNKWAWANQRTKFKSVAPFTYSTSGENTKLDFTLKSKILKKSEKQLSWTFELDARSEKEDVVGGGVSFKLNLSDNQTIQEKPVLLTGNRGWRWGNKNTRGIEILFEPALEKVFFEQGKKSEIRAYFYTNNIPIGERRHTMTVTLYGDIRIRPTIGERFGIEKAAEWPDDSIDLERFPIDLSFLNANEKPAGKHGFLQAKGEALIFEDGSETRFWGTNLSAYTLFKTSNTNILKHAKRLSAMGFNLVRLHHHDSSWVNPNIFGDQTTDNTQTLSEASLDKLDLWIKGLKDEGIYIWLDLHVGRYLREKDNIFAFDEIRQSKRTKRKHKGIDLRGYNYVNKSIKSAMIAFNRNYVSHFNPYTKLAYKDDPAIVSMLVTNENDVTRHYGNRLLHNKGVPQHNKIYMREANEFATKYGLPKNKTWRAWEHGPSKMFLNDLEYRFNIDMIADLKNIGVKVPIAVTSTWGKNPLASLPALTVGDIIDVHSYGSVLELEKNPVFVPNMTAWMAAGQVAGKPMSVTEWNVDHLTAYDRHLASIFVASKASHQGWDAMMQFAYSVGSLDKVGRPKRHIAYNDPAFLATLPAAALLYRNGHVKEANTTYYLSPGASLFYEKINPITSTAIRTASEKGKLLVGLPDTKSLPWLKPSIQPKGSILLRNYKKSLISPETPSVTSDTGELHHNWDRGIYTIDTKMSQAIMGWVGGQTIFLADTVFQVSTPNATVAVQSLDNKQINQSNDILISLATNAVPVRDSKNRSKLPFKSEPMLGKLQIKAIPGLKLYYINNFGTKKNVPVVYSDGQYTIELDQLPLVHWIVLKA